MTKFKSGLTPQLSSITKKVAWFNIFIQLAFYLGNALANVSQKNSQEKNKTINLIDKRSTYRSKDDTGIDCEKI